jgi:hypothetical protein
MISDILANGEMVRLLDFLLDDPFSEYTQTEISKGSGVSRPTISKLIGKLMQLNMILETRKFGITKLYEVNRKSPIIVSLFKFDAELSNAMASAGIYDLNIEFTFKGFETRISDSFEFALKDIETKSLDLDSTGPMTVNIYDLPSVSRCSTLLSPSNARYIEKKCSQPLVTLVDSTNAA